LQGVLQNLPVLYMKNCILYKKYIKKTAFEMAEMRYK